MLKKLLKYDLKSVYKILIVFYGLSIFFSLLTRVFLSIDNSYIFNIIGKVCSGITISMIFNIIINNMMKLWVRFKCNFYNDESYLTHSLPVEKKDLFLSKMLASFTSLFTSLIIIIVSLYIAFYSKMNISIIKNMLLPLAEVYDSTILTIILAFLFICFLEIMNMLFSGYVGIVLGHKKNNNKMGYSILFGFVIYLCTQLFTVISVFITALFNKDLMNLFYTVENVNVDVLKLCVYLAMIIYFINIVILYIINLKLFTKGVDVD